MNSFSLPAIARAVLRSDARSITLNLRLTLRDSDL
jgi:hypothetical protein